MTEGGFSSLSHCTSAALLHRWAEELMVVRRAVFGAVSLFEHDWAPRYIANVKEFTVGVETGQNLRLKGGGRGGGGKYKVPGMLLLY